MAGDTALFNTEEAYFGATLTSDYTAFFGAAGPGGSSVGSAISHGIIKGYTDVVISNEIIKHSRGK